jgi:hypothetical protein
MLQRAGNDAPAGGQSMMDVPAGGHDAPASGRSMMRVVVVGVVESEPVLNYIKDTKNNHTGILTCDHQHVPFARRKNYWVTRHKMTSQAIVLVTDKLFLLYVPPWRFGVAAGPINCYGTTVVVALHVEDT